MEQVNQKLISDTEKQAGKNSSSKKEKKVCVWMCEYVYLYVYVNSLDDD